jgi:hypothetical protein
LHCGCVRYTSEGFQLASVSAFLVLLKNIRERLSVKLRAQRSHAALVSLRYYPGSLYGGALFNLGTDKAGQTDEAGTIHYTVCNDATRLELGRGRLKLEINPFRSWHATCV